MRFQQAATSLCVKDCWEDCLSLTFAMFGARWQWQRQWDKEIHGDKAEENWLPLDCKVGEKDGENGAGEDRGCCFSVGNKIGLRNPGLTGDCLEVEDWQSVQTTTKGGGRLALRYASVLLENGKVTSRIHKICTRDNTKSYIKWHTFEQGICRRG